MAIAIGDIIEITATYSNGVAGTASTVHHYEAQVDSFLIDAFIDAWVAQVWLGIKNSISAQWTLTEVTARNLFDPTEASGKSYNLMGLSPGGGNAMPTFVSFAVTLNHDNPGAIRPGAKRIMGPEEGYSFENGVIEGASYSGISTNLARLADPLTEAVGGLVQLAQPVIVKRIAEIVAGVTRYRLPVNQAEAIIGYVFEAVLNRYLTSQVTRKRGRGV